MLNETNYDKIRKNILHKNAVPEKVYFCGLF